VRGHAPVIVAELGLFEDTRGLLSDERPLFGYIPPQRYHATLVPRAVARLCFFTMLAAFFVPGALLRKLNPFVVAAVCGSLCLLDLAVIYSPYTARDLRAFYASGPMQEIAGSNLNGALWEATRLVHGQGFTVADGLVSWAKMPGYGLFAALAGVLFGDRTFALRTALFPLSSCRCCSTAARSDSLCGQPAMASCRGLDGRSADRDAAQATGLRRSTRSSRRSR
jgi:hypothetical protein